MLNHIIGLTIGYVLDLIVGDPYWMPHPIRWIGSLINYVNQKLLDSIINKEPRNSRKEKHRGLVLVIVVVLVTAIITATLVIGAYRINRWFGIAIEGILICYTLAAKSLRDESMKVYEAIHGNGIESARQAVSMIVGRDTEALDEEGVIKATVETIAENCSDGVIAPLFYAAIGGPILSMIYKSINTMDSMVGYKNDRYSDYGYYAAKLDDVVNYIPSRLSALMLIMAAFILGKGHNHMNAIRIFKRDRYNHKSPNSAQTESVIAGALGVQLAGDAYYFGKLVSKPHIGDATRRINAEDIKRANRLMYMAELWTYIACLGALLMLYKWCL